MIPILFEYNATDFTTHGIGDLVDCFSCETFCNDDGEYELSFLYPKDSLLFSELTIGRLILAKANPWQQKQIFRIYGYEKEIAGKIKVNCEHISYDLNRIPVKAFKAAAGDNANNVLAKIRNNYSVGISGLNASKFTFYSNVSGTAQTQEGYYELETPSSIRSAILDGDDSVKGVFGGNLVLDNYNLKLLTSGSDEGGKNRGVLIEYGADLIDLQQEENISEMYTGVLPYFRYWANDGDEDETYAYGSIQYASGTYQNHRVMPLDLTEYFPNQEEHTAPTVAQLNSKAQEWISKEDGFGEPNINLTLSYAALGQDVRLHDQVTVRFVKMGINSVGAKVSAYKYDVLKERMLEVQVEKAKKSILFSLEDASRLKRGLLPPKRIRNKSITSDKYADGSVGSSAIGYEAVGTDKIAGGAVETDKIAGGAVTSGKIGTGEVKTGNLDTDAVTTSKIKNDAVTRYKILNGEIVGDKIAGLAVSEGKLAGGAVTYAKLAGESVDSDKFTSAFSVIWSDVLAAKQIFAGYIYSEGVMQCRSIIVNGVQFDTYINYGTEGRRLLATTVA